MFKQSVKLKEARLAQRLQEELAFDMRQLEQLLQVTKDEATEISNRKVHYHYYNFLLSVLLDHYIISI